MIGRKKSNQKILVGKCGLQAFLDNRWWTEIEPQELTLNPMYYKDESLFNCVKATEVVTRTFAGD